MTSRIEKLQKQVADGIAAALVLRKLQMPESVYIKIDGAKPAHDQFNAYAAVNSNDKSDFVEYVRVDLANLAQCGEDQP